jgi:hypothetical protein
MSPSPTGPGSWTPASRPVEREESDCGALPGAQTAPPLGAGLDAVQPERDEIAADVAILWGAAFSTKRADTTKAGIPSK